MNDRIEELAKQSGYKHPDAVGLCEDYAYFDHNQFANLIIQECVALLPDDCQSNNGCHMSWTIKEHFGVE